MSRNNFKRNEHKDKALFKLWVKYRQEYVNERLPQIKVYYSHEKPGDATHGFDKLMDLVNRRIEKIEKYRLYNNITKEELKKYPDIQN